MTPLKQKSIYVNEICTTNQQPKVGKKNLQLFYKLIIDSISIDSRSLQNSSSTLYFALLGPNHDGHQYVAELLEQGVTNFVVTYIPSNLQGKANFLVVENTLQALQSFSSFQEDPASHLEQATIGCHLGANLLQNERMRKASNNPWR